MNHFFFSGDSASNQKNNAVAGKRRALPGMLVTRKADGRELTISSHKFHPALHEVCIAPEQAKIISVQTPMGTSTVEINHGILERMPLDALLGLEIAKYVPGGNVMDKRELIRGILLVMGHVEQASNQDILAEKEARLLEEYEAKKAAPKKAAPKKAAPKKDEAKEA